MWPFANRIKDSMFVFQGKDIDLKGVKGTKDDGKGNVYHGMVRYERWEIEAISYSEEGIFMRLSLDNSKYPEIAKYFGRSKIILTYRLTKNQLTIDTEIENRDTKAIPMSLAFHPWFNTPQKGKWQIILPSDKHWQAENQLPIGVLEDVEGTAYDLRNPTVLEGRTYDDVFTQLKFQNGLRLPLFIIQLPIQQ